MIDIWRQSEASGGRPCLLGPLLGALDDFFAPADRTDVLLLYYSGHGRLDHTNTLYLCTADTRTDRLRATAVNSNRLNEMIEASVAARTVIMLDCCHSGAGHSIRGHMGRKV